MIQFQPGQLENLVFGLQRDQFNGVAQIKVTTPPSEIRATHVLAFRKGSIIYGGSHLPSPTELSQKLERHFKLKVMEAALKLADKKVKNQASVREYLELFVRLDLFSWQAVEALIQQQVVLIFEQLLPYSGTIQLDTSIQYDLSYGEDCHGLSWAGIQHDLEQRQQGWASLAPAITTMFVMPQQIKEAQDHIPDAWVKQHLQQWGDGQTSLLSIAAKIDRDPLELAHSYLHWAKMGWISFNQKGATVPLRGSTTSQQELPTILSVDDSPVVQTMIKRAIGDRYNVLLADNAVKALNLLNSQEIKLLLLDVTMPDIDGLELCRTIRSIGKFRNLPVIMLTAKDGMLNKLKSQMAGSTHYLTKPVDRDKLLEVLAKHVPTEAEAGSEAAATARQHQSFSLSTS